MAVFKWQILESRHYLHAGTHSKEIYLNSGKQWKKFESDEF